MTTPNGAQTADAKPTARPGQDERALWRTAARVATRVVIRLVGISALLAVLVLALLEQGGGPLPAGSAAPPVTNVKSLDGRVGAISMATGKPTVVNIWAPWCPPCLQELPAFVRTSEKYSGRVRFVGLAADSDPAQVRAVVQRMGIPYDVAHIDDETTRAWNATSLPSTFVIDGAGHIAWSVRGAIDAATLESHIEPLLATDRDHP